MGIIAALVVVNMALLAVEVGASVVKAMFFALVLGAISPLFSYSFLIFPEMPAALLTIYAFRYARRTGNLFRLVTVGSAIGVLPWMQPRLAPIAAGLLVGFGTRLGNGCTSGHGVCGIGRLSPRSIAATLTFMAAAIATVFITRHVVGA
jgi:uncharacterized membrane protein YedE/YeeE